MPSYPRLTALDVDAAALDKARAWYKLAHHENVLYKQMVGPDKWDYADRRLVKAMDEYQAMLWNLSKDLSKPDHHVCVPDPNLNVLYFPAGPAHSLGTCLRILRTNYTIDLDEEDIRTEDDWTLGLDSDLVEYIYELVT